MPRNPIAHVLILTFAASAALSGCDSTSRLTEEQHIQRAKDSEDKGNLKGSIVELKNAIQKNPDSPQARLLLGQIYLKTGMGAEAEKELSQAEKLGVSRESIKLQLGEALLLMSEYQRVLDEIHPGEQTSKVHLARILQLRADALLKLGKLQEACSLFQQSLDIATDNPPTYWGLAQCAVAERDISKAKEWLDSALKIKDKRSRTWVYIGDWELLNNNSRGAISAYTSALQSEPDNLEALQRRAALSLKLGQLEPARVDIEKIHKLSPKSLAVSYLQALLAFKEKKYPEARDSLQAALKIAPNNLPALLLGGSIENALNNPQTAELHLNKVVRASPHNSFALRLLADTQLRLGRPDDAEKTLAPIDLEKVKDAGILVTAGQIALAKKEFSKAASHFEKAARLSPDNAAIRTDLGLARLRQGDDRAMADLQAAVGMGGSDHRADNVIILKQLKQGQFDAALVSIAALEKEQPQSPLPWNFRGAAYLGKKDTAKARSSFNQALKLDPKSFAAAANLAQLDLAEGQAANARQRFEGILKVSPKHLQAMLALADLALRDKDEKGYVSWLEKAMQAHPQALQPRAAMTRYLLGKGETSKALASAREAVDANPDDPEALDLLGSTQMATGDKTASATFTKLANKAQSPNAYLRLAQSQITNKNLVGARGTLQKALQLQPNHLPSQDALLRLELAEDKPEAALQIARRIQGQQPGSPLGYDREADIQFSQKRLPQAVMAYERALERGAGSTGSIKLARAQVALKRHADARTTLIKALVRTPGDPGVLIALAGVELADGKTDEALKYARQVTQQEPAGGTGYMLEGDVLMQQKKYAEAVPVYEKAFAISKSRERAIRVHQALVGAGRAADADARLLRWLKEQPNDVAVRSYQAESFIRRQRIPAAIEQYESLLKSTPGNVRALNNLAALYQGQGDARALPTAERAFKLEPSDPNVMDTLGWILLDQGEPKRALVLLKQAAAKAPEARSIRYHYAVALVKTGDRTGGRRELNGLLKAGKPFPETDAAQALLKTL